MEIYLDLVKKLNILIYGPDKAVVEIFNNNKFIGKKINWYKNYWILLIKLLINNYLINYLIN